MKIVLKLILKLIFGFFISSLLMVAVQRFINIPVTPLMVIRVVEGLKEGKLLNIEKKWTNYESTSKNAYRAFISAEDARFLRHEGIDWKAVDAAKRYNEIKKGKKFRGASTITMQTAKNAFLWHERSWARKGLEVYFTYLIEYLWGKKRILEVYGNVVEMGEGVYGLGGASEKFFNKAAEKLSIREAALIAAVLPNPRRWTPTKPTRYIEKRVAFIRSRMGGIALPE